MTESLGIIAWCLNHLNYWTIFLLMTVESSFIPFPSEVVVPPAAMKVALGELNGFGVVLCSLAGSMAGALINYLLAFHLGRPIVYTFARSRMGKMMLLSEEKLFRAESYFDQRGAVSTFVGRLIPGIRQLISIPAGLARMRMAPFLCYTALGAGSWILVLFALGYYGTKISGFTTREELMTFTTRYSHWIGYSILAIVVVVILVLWLVRRKRRKRRAMNS